jgi:hypothetical protein
VNLHVIPSNAKNLLFSPWREISRFARNDRYDGFTGGVGAMGMDMELCDIWNEIQLLSLHVKTISFERRPFPFSRCAFL